MMSGYVTPPSDPPSGGQARYRVVRKDGGWCVCVNGCETRPFADRDSAERLARRLQIQWDHLNHAPIVLEARAC
jgi:hypothetical protein